MKWMTLIAIGLKILFKFTLALLLMSWDALSRFVDIVDYDDDHRPNEMGPHYNYHTGEIDPVQYSDGIYNRDL